MGARRKPKPISEQTHAERMGRKVNVSIVNRNGNATVTYTDGVYTRSETILRELTPIECAVLTRLMKARISVLDAKWAMENYVRELCRRPTRRDAQRVT